MAAASKGPIDTRLAVLEALRDQIDTDHDRVGDLESDIAYLKLSELFSEKVSAAGAITKNVTLVTTANADKAMTLPDAASVDTVYDFIVAKVDAAGSGKVVLTPAAGNTVNGAATLTSPASARATVHVISDGVSDWMVLSTSGTWT